MIFQIGSVIDKKDIPSAVIWCNKNNARIEEVGGKLKIIDNPVYAPSKEDLIGTQQRFLDETDYKIIKALEAGESIDESLKAKRQVARDEINRLRALL